MEGNISMKVRQSKDVESKLIASEVGKSQTR